MWRAIKARLAKRRWVAVGLYAACGLFAAGLAISLPQMRQPERLAAIIGALALLVGFLAQVAFHSADEREKRRSLHFTLPIPRRQLVVLQIVEPMLIPVVYVTVSLAVATIARLLIGGDFEVLHLLLLISVACFMMLCDQVLLLCMEARERLDSVVLLKFLVPMALAMLGAAIGFLLASWVLESNSEQAWVLVASARPEVATGLGALIALLAYINYRLISTRKSYLS